MLVETLAHNAVKFGNREALRFRDYKTQQWTSISWNDFKKIVDRMALSFEMLGLKAADKIALYTQN